MTDATKEAIKKVVLDYQTDFPEDYASFRQYNLEKQDNSKDFAETGMDYVERGLWEMPEVCLNSIKMKLDEAQWEWFQSKEGGRWVAKTFPDFRMSHKV